MVDKPGYMTRYAKSYEQPWLLCKTAYAILIERAVKYAQKKGDILKIYFEEAGKSEDHDLLAYDKALRREGMPFDHARSAHYSGLKPTDFQSVISGDPNRVTKAVPMIQIADMMLYPMVKGGYHPSYAPYSKLLASKRIIDALLPVAEVASCGVKYSCFDGKR